MKPFASVGVIAWVIAISVSGFAESVPEFNSTLHRHSEKPSSSALATQDAQAQFALGVGFTNDSNPRQATENDEADNQIEEILSVRFMKKWSKKSSVKVEYQGNFRQYLDQTDLGNNEQLLNIGLESKFGIEDRMEFKIANRFGLLSDVSAFDATTDAEVAMRNVNELNPVFSSKIGQSFRTEVGMIWRLVSYTDEIYEQLNSQTIAPFLQFGYLGLGKNMELYGQYSMTMMSYENEDRLGVYSAAGFTAHSMYIGFSNKYLKNLDYNLRLGFSMLTVTDEAGDTSDFDNDDSSDLSAMLKVDYKLLKGERAKLSAIFTRGFVPSSVSNFAIANSFEMRWTHMFGERKQFEYNVGLVYTDVARSIEDNDVNRIGARAAFSYWYWDKGPVNSSAYLAFDFASRAADNEASEYDRTRMTIGVVASY
ncbi:MAG: hypothetical protein ABIH86_03315 [Planctomycetota bacterium]